MAALRTVIGWSCCAVSGVVGNRLRRSCHNCCQWRNRRAAGVPEADVTRRAAHEEKILRQLWQRRLLMPLVQPEGIYCFYSRQLVNALAALIVKRTCLEIAAGDGTLTRFLAGSGVRITATDDYSWKHEVKYPEFVVRKDAGEALREYAPEVVLCSWPPAGNAFEQQVFRTKSVQLYIVVSSRHRFAAGNWDDYQRQSAFERGEDEALSSSVLPPELDAAVYLFRRKEV